MKASESSVTLEAVNLAHEGKHKEAADLINKKIAQLQRAAAERSEIVTLMNDLAVIYLDAEDRDSALKTYQLVLALQEDEFGPSSLEAVKTLVNIANVQFALQNFEAVSLIYTMLSQNNACFFQERENEFDLDANDENESKSDGSIEGESVDILTVDPIATL
jgi:tetratricopeptide (TPR) repeat protein